MLHSPVPFKKEFIESKFIAPLQEVLHNLTGDPITIVVVTGEYTAPSTSTSPYDDYTFERFIVGSSNKFAHAAAPVSYTHLDVYKRQPSIWPPYSGERLRFARLISCVFAVV